MTTGAFGWPGSANAGCGVTVICLRTAILLPSRLDLPACAFQSTIAHLEDMIEVVEDFLVVGDGDDGGVTHDGCGAMT